MSSDNSDVSSSRIALYTEKFSAGPIGVWQTELDYQMGWGFSGLPTGLIHTMEFRSDGTGYWQEAYDDSTKESLTWRSLGPLKIAIDFLDQTELVEFEFFSPSGSTAVLMRNVNHSPEKDEFWIGVGPVGLYESELGHPEMGSLEQTRAVYRALAELQQQHRLAESRAARWRRIGIVAVVFLALLTAAAFFHWADGKTQFFGVMIPMGIVIVILWELWERRRRW